MSRNNTVTMGIHIVALTTEIFEVAPAVGQALRWELDGEFTDVEAYLTSMPWNGGKLELRVMCATQYDDAPIGAAMCAINWVNHHSGSFMCNVYVPGVAAAMFQLGQTLQFASSVQSKE